MSLSNFERMIQLSDAIFSSRNDPNQLNVDENVMERELTPLNTKYEAIYLCSALLLEEFRGKGIAQELCIEAIEGIKIAHLFDKFMFVCFRWNKTNRLFSKNFIPVLGNQIINPIS